MGEYLPNKKSVWRKTLYEIMYGKLNVISAFLLTYTSEVNYVFFDIMCAMYMLKYVIVTQEK